MSVRSILALALTAVLLLQGVCEGANAKDADDDQYAFLSELYDLTSGSMWKNNTNWLIRNNDTTLCNWHGITCSGKWVEKIDLSGNGLGGPLPDKWERIPYLDNLDLSSNKILDKIPASIGNLSLTNLILSHNSLKGTIPSSIGNIGARLLYLDNNQLTGTLPSSIAMKSLVGLTLDLNKLSGPVPKQLGDIGAQLMVISAAFNYFTGTLPQGVCKANSCNFQYDNTLGCPSKKDCGKCMLPSCM